MSFRRGKARKRINAQRQLPITSISYLLLSQPSSNHDTINSVLSPSHDAGGGRSHTICLVTSTPLSNDESYCLWRSFKGQAPTFKSLLRPRYIPEHRWKKISAGYGQWDAPLLRESAASKECPKCNGLLGITAKAT